MKMGIMADSHDNLDAIAQAVAAFNDLAVDWVIHAGDYVAPFTFRVLSRLNAPIFGVFGNNDGEKAGLLKAVTGLGEIHDPPAVFTREGVSILVVHDLDTISAVEKVKEDVVVCGHTHRYLIEDEKRPLVINPGETGGWLNGKRTVALLDTADMKAEIINL